MIKEEWEKENPNETRVSFSLPTELHEKMKKTIPWGIRSYFFRKIVEISLNRIAEGGYEVIGAVLSGDYDPLTGRSKE